MGFVSGPVDGPVVEYATRLAFDVTHITRSGDALGVTRARGEHKVPAPPTVPGQRSAAPAEPAAEASRVAWVPQEHQMVSATAGRIALDGYSWMQAVHWVHGAGLYLPQDGPKFGETTIKLAEILAQLTPCRPGIAYLKRELKRSERTVQYHLEILRSTGLLAWRSVGTRLPMTEGQTRVESLASEYERLIPVSYDQALGIRTAGEGVERRMTGISEEGRGLIATLGRKAAQRLRRTRRHTGTGRTVSTSRCTPMEGGTTDCLSSPSVGDVKATGGARDTKSSTRKKRAAKPAGTGGERRRTVLGQVVTTAMMAVGDKLARVAYRRVPWVRQASHDQLRWVLNDAAARGWDEQRTMAWLGEIAGQYGCAGVLWRPERPHSLIAHALRQEVEQDAYDRQLAADSAAAVDPMSNAAMRELREEMEARAAMERLFAAVPEPVEQADASTARAEAFYYPAAVAEEISGDVDAALDRYGADLAARLIGLEANPNVILGVRR